MAGRLGTLVIELAANTARLQTDMGKAVGIAERGAASIKKAFTFVTAGLGGGLIGGSLLGAARQAITLGDELQKAATKAGVGAKTISELAYAAKLADVDLASLSTALKKMQISISEAGSGSKQPIQALQALGLTFQQLQKRSPSAQFEVIADRISKLTDPADRARAATELFGKAGADLLPLFAEGAAGIAKARAEAEKLGLSFGDDQLKALADADDSVKRLKESWAGFATTLTAMVAPALSTVFDRLSGLDTRGISQKIADTERALLPRRGQQQSERQRLAEQLAQLRGLSELDQVRQFSTGTRGGPQGRSESASARGYGHLAAMEAAAVAQAAATKAAEAAEKERLAFLDRMDTRMRETYDTVDDLSRDSLRRQQEEWMKNEDEKAEFLKKFMEQGKFIEDTKISESAAFFRDSFLNAFDDVVNTAKFKFSNFLTFLAAEFARRGIAKLFESATSKSSSSTGGAKQGFWSLLGSGLSSLFAGGKAAGGPVSGGKMYMVGEEGPELFAPGASGSIIPNDKIGGRSTSITWAPTINMNGSGSREDARRLRRMMDEQRRRDFDDYERRGLFA